MRIGVISDTHIPEKADRIPQKILNEFKNVDIIVHAGDLGDITVLEELNSTCNNVKAVWGNMDPQEVRSRLSNKQVFKAGKYKIGLMHGYGPPKGLLKYLSGAFSNEKLDIIIFGHSHEPFNETIGEVLYFNPGSATDKAFAEYNSYGIIEIDDGIKAKIIRI